MMYVSSAGDRFLLQPRTRDFPVAHYRQIVTNKETGKDKVREIVGGEATIFFVRSAQQAAHQALCNLAAPEPGNYHLVVRKPKVDRNTLEKLCAELRLQLHFNHSRHFVRTLGSFTPAPSAGGMHLLPITIMHRYKETLLAWMHAKSHTLKGMRAGGSDANALRRMLHQVLKALAVMHKSGVAHRDLSGNNVLVDEKGNAFVGDFGYAEEAAELPLKEKEGMAFLGRGHVPNTNADADDESAIVTVAVADASDADGYGAEPQAVVPKEEAPSAPKCFFKPMPGLDGIASHTGAIPGTSWYAAPEALLCVDPSQYDPRKLDMFALGVTGMGAVIGDVGLYGKGRPFADIKHIPIVQYFEMVAPYDDALYGDALAAVVKRYGYPDYRSYLRKRAFNGSFLSSVGTTPTHDPQLLSLLKQMLAANPSARPTAEEALAHPYFAGLSAEVEYLPPLGHAPTSAAEVQQYMRDAAPVWYVAA